MRVVTFYPNGYEELTVHTYKVAKEAADNGMSMTTTQMCMLNHVKDYDQIDIDYNDDFYDIDHRKIVTITNNHNGTYSCDRTNKEIRRAHNLFKMWENGVFDL